MSRLGAGMALIALLAFTLAAQAVHAHGGDDGGGHGGHDDQYQYGYWDYYGYKPKTTYIPWKFNVNATKIPKIWVRCGDTVVFQVPANSTHNVVSVAPIRGYQRKFPTICSARIIKVFFPPVTVTEPTDYSLTYTKTGSFYYICNVNDGKHCTIGKMAIRIDVGGKCPPASPPSPSTYPPPVLPSPSVYPPPPYPPPPSPPPPPILGSPSPAATPPPTASPPPSSPPPAAKASPPPSSPPPSSPPPAPKASPPPYSPPPVPKASPPPSSPPPAPTASPPPSSPPPAPKASPSPSPPPPTATSPPPPSAATAAKTITQNWAFGVGPTTIQARCGDSVVFSSPGGTHDVVEVSGDKCTDTQLSPQIYPITDGAFTTPPVLLSTAGQRTFICSVGSHCSAGMIVTFNVVC